MDVVFHRTGRRSYAIDVTLASGSVLRMDPAPGFDAYFPHDLQHLIVEEQLSIANGIFGRLDRGGTASSFEPVRASGSIDQRAAARHRRRLRDRNLRLGAGGADDFARSERATYIAWQDWLAHCPEADLRQRAAEMEPTARSILERMGRSERDSLLAVLPRLRARVDEVARCWAAVSIGDSLRLTWSSVPGTTVQ